MGMILWLLMKIVLILSVTTKMFMGRGVVTLKLYRFQVVN